MPEGWINGQVEGVCVDDHDHIVIVDRWNITEEETETSGAPPPIPLNKPEIRDLAK